MRRKIHFSARSAYHLTVMIVFIYINCLWADEPLLSDTVLGDNWARKGELREFTHTDLFEQINGGAELFLELGFEQLRIQNYSDGERELEIEIYKMTSAPAAKSIFFSRRARPASQKAEKQISINRYQCLFSKGVYYVQINNFTGDTTLLPLMSRIAENVSDKIPDVPVSLLARLPEQDRVTGTEAIFNGPISLRPVFAAGSEDVFLLQRKVFGIAGEYLNEENELQIRIIIPYPDSTSATAALKNFSQRTAPCPQIISQAKNKMEFRTCDQKYATMSQLGTSLKIVIYPDRSQD